MPTTSIASCRLARGFVFCADRRGTVVANDSLLTFDAVDRVSRGDRSGRHLQYVKDGVADGSYRLPQRFPRAPSARYLDCRILRWVGMRH